MRYTRGLLRTARGTGDGFGTTGPERPLLGQSEGKSTAVC